MGSEYTVSTKLGIPRNVLWQAISSNSRAFMNHLVTRGALNRMDSTPIENVEGGSATEKTRKQMYVPKTIEIPDAIKTVFDDSYLEIEDVQTWDESIPYQLKFSIMPGVLGDYVKMSGVTTFECCPEDINACVQTIRGTCKVEIPFLGWYVEQAIIQNMNSFYDSYPLHIDNFVARLINEYSATLDSLLPALDRMEREAISQKCKDVSPAGAFVQGDSEVGADTNDVNGPDRAGGDTSVVMNKFDNKSSDMNGLHETTGQKHE